MISPGQCRAARSYLGWSRERLAKATGVSRAMVADFEAESRETLTGMRRALQKTLEAQGIVFPARSGGKASILFADRTPPPNKDH